MVGWRAAGTPRGCSCAKAQSAEMARRAELCVWTASLRALRPQGSAFMSPSCLCFWHPRARVRLGESMYQTLKPTVLRLRARSALHSSSASPPQLQPTAPPPSRRRRRRAPRCCRCTLRAVARPHPSPRSSPPRPRASPAGPTLASSCCRARRPAGPPPRPTPQPYLTPVRAAPGAARATTRRRRCRRAGGKTC